MATSLARVEIFAGNYRVLQFVVADKDLDPTGATPKNLTGLIVHWALARTKDGKLNRTPMVDKFSPSDGVTITNAAAGECEVEIFGVDTEALIQGDFYQELEVDDGAGKTLVVATGPVLLKPNVDNI